ncbi:thioredoxin domain-containing protein 5 [Ceratina calcarata]|uniref:Thioredoxin domain-containing protein 5 n=1 Tax=Ceratina calcarata TaxID=156304 RepID=A0AAJ7N937_9HYME|nr:thioredoxin domain-containing protein 5 [Ceratina calcarata]
MASFVNCIMLKKYVLLFAFMLSQVNSEENDHVHKHATEYTKDDFSAEIQKKNHFVMFHAPWCGHCQRLEPTWEQLAEMSNQEDNIKIAKVDCTTDHSLCTEHDVTGYPTLKFFKAGEAKGTKYRGRNDLSSLISFLSDQLGTAFGSGDVASLPPGAVNSLLELTTDTFYKHVFTGYHFINFYAPWCGFCKKLAPVWEELANSLRNNNHVSISRVDCISHPIVCEKFEIEGFPTMLWIEDGKKVDKYTGQRTHEELKAYVSKMLDKGEDQVKTDNSDSTAHAVLSLTGESFKHGIEKGVSFVKFFAPWCGHCKRLAQIWKDLGKKFVTDDNVKIIKVDCTLDVSKELCNEQEVDGFPTLYLYRDGVKVSEYIGAPILDDLYEFVMNHVQPHDEL